jgi:hypothetical protein
LTNSARRKLWDGQEHNLLGRLALLKLWEDAMFKDFEWVFTALLVVSLVYTAYIVGYAIYLGDL